MNIFFPSAPVCPFNCCNFQLKLILDKRQIGLIEVAPSNMSHIEDFLANTVATPAMAHRRGDITSAWDCYTAGGRSAKQYRYPH